MWNIPALKTAAMFEMCQSGKVDKIDIASHCQLFHIHGTTSEENATILCR